MSKQTEIRLTGSGGQGIILAGIILAEAAIGEGNNAIQSQSYGPEARGGASKAEVIISSNEIHFPKVQEPNYLLALTQVAADKYLAEVNEECVVIVDSAINVPSTVKAKKIISIPILKTAAEDVGKSIVGNIVAVGAITEITGVVSRAAVETALLNRVPKGTEDLNKTALEAGYKLALNR
ncbi:MAG: 2-oxoacid:acceptor oxidoreductase family protein [Clostridia bacterium]|nr:2-oxoacid:acceptor oxidoreductase family protein [Clostridia bacterium]